MERRTLTRFFRFPYSWYMTFSDKLTTFSVFKVKMRISSEVEEYDYPMHSTMANTTFGCWRDAAIHTRKDTLRSQIYLILLYESSTLISTCSISARRISRKPSRPSSNGDRTMLTLRSPCTTMASEWAPLKLLSRSKMTQLWSAMRSLPIQTCYSMTSGSRTD